MEQPLEEKTMHPLILLFRLGDPTFHPPSSKDSHPQKFQARLVNGLWRKNYDLSPAEYFKLVRTEAQNEAHHNGLLDERYLQAILEHSILDHIDELNLGKWGDDLKDIYVRNMHS